MLMMNMKPELPGGGPGQGPCGQGHRLWCRGEGAAPEPWIAESRGGWSGSATNGRQKMELEDNLGDE